MCGTAVVNKMQPYSTYIILIKLPGIAVYSYTLDRIPWSACVFYLILYCPSTLSLRPTNPSISLRIPIYCSFLYCSSCLHNMCPIQFHFLLLIWLSIEFWWVVFHTFSFVILSGHFIFIMLLKNLFTNKCSLLVIWFVVFQVSQAYKNTDFLFALNIYILTSFDMLRFFYAGCMWNNTTFPFFILLATSSSVPPPHDTTLPRHTKNKLLHFPFPLT